MVYKLGQCETNNRVQFLSEGTNSVTNEPKFTINVIYNDTFEESVQFRKVLIYFTA